MPGVSFDRAVEYYDETRGFAPGVAENIRDAIINYTQVGPTSSRFLELGVGTGRIALPFIEAGYDYTGVDISLNMMEMLRKKLAKISAEDSQTRTRPAFNYQLLQADITQELPFAAASFDVVISVHVLHLVENWQAVLTQAQQVLKKPDGWLILAHDELIGDRRRSNHTANNHSSGEAGDSYQNYQPPDDPPKSVETDLDPHTLVNAKWDSLIRELGIEPRSLRRGTWLADETLETYLRQELGATTVQTVTLLEYERQPISLATMAARHQAQMYSGDWNLPPEVHAEASHRLQCWLDEEVGTERANQPIVTRGDFKALTAKWAS